MSDQPQPQPVTGSGLAIILSLGILAVGTAAFLCGYMTHEGMAKASVDDFGKVKLQDHIYAVELVRAPYEPETVTIAEMKARAAEKVAEE